MVEFLKHDNQYKPIDYNSNSYKLILQFAVDFYNEQDLNKRRPTMDNLIPIEHKGQRVLTTQQLAESYETDVKNIQINYQRNQERYFIGVHYFKLEGQALKEFKETYLQIVGEFKNAPSLMLWTEKGALLHAKSLGTDKAWQVYEMLVDTYFRAKELIAPKSPAELIAAGYKAALDLIEEMKPKARKFDELIDSSNYQAMEQAAKVLNIGRNTLFKLLRLHHIFTERNLPGQSYIDRGYFVVKEYSMTINGEQKMYAQSFVTAKGINFLHEFLDKHRHDFD